MFEVIDILIVWQAGYAVVHVQAFFPATPAPQLLPPVWIASIPEGDAVRLRSVCAATNLHQIVVCRDAMGSSFLPGSATQIAINADLLSGLQS